MRANGRLVCLCIATLVAPVAPIPVAASPAAPEPGPLTLTASGISVTIDRQTGHATSFMLNSQEELATLHSAGSVKPYGYIEAVDLRARRTYNPLTANSTISDWSVTGSPDNQVLTFTQQYEGAPFQIVQTLNQDPAGLRWQATLRLLPGQDANRSVRVDWVLPLPSTWKIWAPSNLAVHETNGVTPFRFGYAHSDYSPFTTVIPLVGIWNDKSGAAVFSPPNVRKSQVIFEVQTQGNADVGTGVLRQLEDLQSLHVAHHMIGLRPGKDLTLAITIAGTRPDWRGVLGHYVNSYPDLFEPIPETRKWEGMYAVTTPTAWTPQDRAAGRADRMGRGAERIKAARATCVEIHGHFLEYGYFISDDIINNPDREFICESHPSGKMTYAGNRKLFREMLDLGIGPFVYFYNVHAAPETIEQRFAQDLMRSEQGKTLIQWDDEPSLVAQPDSPFGKNLLEQLHLLIKAYPEVPGFFVDNYSIQKIDFAHDDGVTMVHNRPCYDMNRNHQDVGTRCHEIAHKARKIMMVNKLATIESARGADMVLLEGGTVDAVAITGLACVNRPFFPLNWEYPDRTHAVERCLQYLLVWGGTPYTRLDRTLETLNAYRPLTDAMIGKRWVFDADPLTLPSGYDGQIFRIDQHAPCAGDVVVTIVDLKKSWRDAKFTEDLAVTVRLPEAEQLRKVTWLPVEKSQDSPQPCDFERQGHAIKIKLPPVGAAGILRLTR